MALQSRLFRGNSRLQECALHDRAHVLPKSKGDHVYRIQTALTWLEFDIDADDIAATLYGTSTADAVLAYKKDRKIINRSYQTQADNIVGKMTVTALDKELVAIDRAAVIVAVGCDCEFCDGFDQTANSDNRLVLA